MSRTMMRSALAFVAVAAAAGYFTTHTSGQGTGLPSTKAGDWPMYNADLKGTRYSPLDQINGTNFSKLELAWHFKTDNLGSRPEFKLEGTPLVVNGILYATGGTRRSVFALKADTGEMLWVHAELEGERGLYAPRQLSGRGVSYWTDGRGDDRVDLCHDRVSPRRAERQDRLADSVFRQGRRRRPEGRHDHRHRTRRSTSSRARRACIRRQRSPAIPSSSDRRLKKA